MKKITKVILLTLTTLCILIMGQACFASGTVNAATNGLSSVEIIGAVGLVIIAIVAPLVRGSRREVTQK